MNTQTLLHWPTGASYEGERFRFVRYTNRGRDIVIVNNEGYKATVSPESVEVIN